jgi:hypothetical protein
MNGYAETQAGRKYKLRRIVRNLTAINEGKVGHLLKYQINPVRMVKTMHPVGLTLYYESITGKMHKYPNQVYFEMASKQRIKYPSEVEKLRKLLADFEAKNCEDLGIYKSNTIANR